MAAGEDESQPVVGDRAHVALRIDARLSIDGRELRLDRRFAPEQLGLLGEPFAAPQSVDRPVPRGRHDPGAGIVRDATRRPRLEGRQERFLDRFLGEIEVAKDPDERSDDPTRLLAKELVDDDVWIGWRMQASE